MGEKMGLLYKKVIFSYGLHLIKNDKHKPL